MKKWLGLLVALGLAAAPDARAQDRLTLQLKWVTQAQFAGYYVAQARGFYRQANLDVRINPGGPDIAPPQIIAGNRADVIVEWMPAALASRERGVPLVNVAQPFRRSGLQLTCRAETGIRAPQDLRGRTLGVWFSGNEYPFLAWMSRLGYRTDGSPQGVRVLRQGFNVDPLLQRQADCVSTMSYNEYWQVIDGGFRPDQLVVFSYEEQGVATLEDGLYVLEGRLNDAAFVQRMARFVRASMQGWDWARQNPDQAAQIVIDNDTTGAQTIAHQRRMMGEIAKLLDAQGGGRLVPADYERTVQTLLSSGGDSPVITRAPTGAWTHAVMDAAR
ncbi:ABC transporter substrate-binding protein [Falsiroseomonas sp. HW251]|uniref:ABC transporter substrate-binding protein n=1 Tax=Falsiroseomonas sp. HW251 TaxID=3390998 RepID=UPI003D317CB5